MKISILIISLFLTTSLFSQTKFSLETQRLFKIIESKKSQSHDLLNAIESNGISVNKRNGNNYCSFLAKVNSQFSKTSLYEFEIEQGSKLNNIISLHVPINQIENLKNIKGIDYIQLARKIDSSLKKALADTRVDSVHKGLDLPQAITGKDVIIGITDWGFDYTHPGFYDTLYTETRILKAWDQFRNQGPAPQGFSYGTEISGHLALQQAQCDTFNIYEWATHGSHVAGIAGGNGAGTQYRGVAYEANFLLTTFLVNEASVFDAFNWMKNEAEQLQKRLVINMSWGLHYMGNLDGTSLLGEIIDDLSNQGVVFVASGGNNGDVNFHLKHDFSFESDTLFSIVNFDNYNYYPHMWGQAVTLFGQENCHFNCGFIVTNSSYDTLAFSPMYNTLSNEGYVEDTIIIGSDTIPYNIAIESSNVQNHKPHVHLRIKNKSTNKIVLSLLADTGLVHAWNVIELDNGVGNWGLPFTMTTKPFFKDGDNKYGIGEPSCNNSVISVAAYLSETILPSGNIVGGTIAGFSSYGPTADERIKPEISAPGVSVISSLSSFTNYVPSSSNIVETISWQGRNYKYCKMSGTSMSGPMITGIVALMLEANPQLTPFEIKEILKETAREDIKTGYIPDTGSTRWGWGKVHAWNAINLSLNNPIISNEPHSIIVFPNPCTQHIEIISKNENSLNAELYSISGVLLKTKKIDSGQKFDISEISSGIYILKVIEKNSISTTRLIIE